MVVGNVDVRDDDRRLMYPAVGQLHPHHPPLARDDPPHALARADQHPEIVRQPLNPLDQAVDATFGSHSP